jgi:hypothetical protein
MKIKYCIFYIYEHTGDYNRTIQTNSCSGKRRGCMGLADFFSILKRFFRRIKIKMIFKNGHQKYNPNRRYVSGCFVPLDVFDSQTFCPMNFMYLDILSPWTFFRLDVLSLCMFCPTRRFVLPNVLSLDV